MLVGNQPIESPAAQGEPLPQKKRLHHELTHRVEHQRREQRKGVSAEPVTVMPDQKEAKLVIRAAADTPAGQAPVVTIRATAMVNDTLAVVQETKVIVNLAK